MLYDEFRIRNPQRAGDPHVCTQPRLTHAACGSEILRLSVPASGLPTPLPRDAVGPPLHDGPALLQQVVARVGGHRRRALDVR